MIQIKKIDTNSNRDENEKALRQVILLFKEYQAELNENLCFQSFDEELHNPMMVYGKKGAILYAVVDHTIVGCVAVKQLQADVCEMKRLFVQPPYRKLSVGKLLVKAILDEASKMGYSIMKLDTLERLVPAIQLYEQFGFRPTNSYYSNPLPNVVYMEKQLH